MMNIHSILFIIFGLIVLSSSGYADSQKGSTSHAYEQNDKEKIEASGKRKPGVENNSFQKLTYAPPFLGAPSKNNRLVGMALRGSTNDLILSVLTPEHTGLSMDAQPDIYWYTSKPVSKPFQFVEFVLNSDAAIKPILRTHLPSVTKGGIQKLSLSDYNITLEPDVEYTWVISLVPDPTTRSYDIVTSGKIKHVATNDQFQKTVRSALQNQHSNIFAQAGFWYDALAEIIEQTEKKPKEFAAREELVSLLKQVELDQVAENIGYMDPG